MATVAPGLPQENRETLAQDVSGMGNFLIDPAGAAPCVFRKWFWVGPMLVVSMVAVTVQWLMLPIVQHVLEVAPVPANTNPEQYQKSMQIALTIQRAGMFATPLIMLAMTAIQAGIVLGTSSLLGVKAKFLNLFNLVAGISLISALSAIATIVVLKVKGEVSTMAELKPPLGLDIFLSEGANKFLLSTLGYFSVFQVWAIVVFVFTFSYAFRTKKMTALTAYLPVIALSIMISLIGAAFAPK